MNKNKKIYVILSIICVLTYIWISFFIYNKSHNQQGISVCIFKNITNIPCLSCGTTRSIFEILHANFHKAFITNPLGYIYTFLLITFNILLIYDLGMKKKSIPTTLLILNNKLKNPKYLITILLLIIINWIWVIYNYKGL